MKLSLLLLGVARAGTHTRHPFLGVHSAFYSTDSTQDASFDGRLPFAKGMTRRHVDGAVFNMRALGLSWEGMPPASRTGGRDLIAISCDEPNWGIAEAFDAIAVPPSALEAGHGKVELPALPELRCTYVARYVRDEGNGHGTVLAEQALLAKQEGVSVDLPRPTSLHIGFTSKRDEMLVIWVSGGGGHLSVPPTVEWGFSSGNLTHTVVGTSSTYHASDLCNAPANRSGPLAFIDPGAIHRVTISGLPSLTRIFYRAGGAGHRHWTKEHSFMSRRAAPSPSTPSTSSTANASIKFLMYADQALPVPIFEGAWRMTKQVVADIEAGYDAFLLHPGDLGYAEGSGYIWDVWGAFVEPITARVPYMVTVGNHEYDHVGMKAEGSGAPAGGWHPLWGNLHDDSHGECGVPVSARFNGTGSAHPTVEGSNGVFWYSFEEGLVLRARLDPRLTAVRVACTRPRLRRPRRNTVGRAGDAPYDVHDADARAGRLQRVARLPSGGGAAAEAVQGQPDACGAPAFL